MIDDRIDVFFLIAENGIPVLLFDAPYNQGFDQPNVFRVFDWSDIYSAVLWFHDLFLRKLYEIGNNLYGGKRRCQGQKHTIFFIIN